MAGFDPATSRLRTLYPNQLDHIGILAYGAPTSRADFVSELCYATSRKERARAETEQRRI